MRYRMFCAELDGELVLGYICHSAGDVRRTVCKSIRGTYSPDRWSELRRHGWKVVKVGVEKIS